MDMKEKNDIFIDNTNFQGRMAVFHDKLRKHLSNEYLFLSEKKDNLENEILQLKMEKEQKDKTLFPNIGKKDMRKYFSPLNISEIDEEQKDEKEKQLLANINRISEEAEMLDSRMSEIKDFLDDIEDMLNRKVTIKNMEDFTIVGIVDQKSPSIYVNKNLMINIISNSVDEEKSETNIIDYTLYQNDYVLKEGRLPEQDYEVIVNIINKESMPLNKTIKTEINGHKLTVVGYYTSKNNYDYYFVNNRTVEYNLVTTKGNLTIYPNNKENCLNEFRSLNLNIEDSYTQSKREYLKENQENLKNSIFVASVILIISLIEMFLMMRSSFLSRIKEVGIYRAIGVKKSDIYKMFMGEIIAITTLASLPGLIIMAYILKTLSTIKYLDGLFLINSTVLIISIILVYGFNLLVGLLPVFNTIRKTPAQILSRHDLD